MKSKFKKNRLGIVGLFLALLIFFFPKFYFADNDIGTCRVKDFECNCFGIITGTVNFADGVGLCFGIPYQCTNYPNANQTSCSQFNPTPTPFRLPPQNQTLIQTIMKHFNNQISKVEVLVLGDTYAYGTAISNEAIANDTSGFYWLAQKINNKWTYVGGGQDIPPCSVISYFPATSLRGYIDSCVDTNTQQIIALP